MTLVLGDWGSTRLRLYRMAGSSVAAEAEGPGIAAVGAGARAALAEALARLGGPRPETVLLCGMAGARGALIEVPYAPCPADVAEWARATAWADIDAMRVGVAAGLSCRNLGGGPDVMRGEEAQVFGACRLAPALAEGTAWVIHPGTHAKWIALEAARIIRFHTVPTGELFALLSERSSLLSLAGGDDDPGHGFTDGLAAARPGGALAHLFATRAAQLLDGRGRGWARAYLSGLLIGGEFAAMLALAGVERLTIVGDPRLTAPYALAAGEFGLTADELDGEAAVLAGLALLHPEDRA